MVGQIIPPHPSTREVLATWQDAPLYTGPSIWATKKGLTNFGAGLFYFGPREDIGWQKS